MHARPGLRGILPALCLLALIPLGATGARAQVPDQIGIFFDADFTLNETTQLAFPSVLTGYLVLSNPTSTTGVGGWELCVEAEGPVRLVSWTLEGQTINVETPPCFMVGVGGDPLPSGEHILLATFQLLVEGLLPARFSVGPIYHATLPGQMAYLVGGDPEDVRPLNLPAYAEDSTIAWLNLATPWYEVTPDSLYMGETYLGGLISRSLTVANPGNAPLELDISLAPDCNDFSLPGLSGPQVVPAGGQILVDVDFVPSVLGLVECTLHLGGIAPDVPLSGRGREPTTSWNVPLNLDFGEIPVGLFCVLPLVIQNTGNTDLPIAPAPAPGCAMYAVQDPTPFLLPAGQSRTLAVVFSPTVTGDATCSLELGSVVPPVELLGNAREANPGWTLPSGLDFGEVPLGRSAALPLEIANTGETYLPLAFTLTGDGAAFSVTPAAPVNLAPGQTLALAVTFAPTALGEAACLLDLGAVLPQVSLTGAGREADLAWDLLPEEIDFLSAYVGQTVYRQLAITNAGESDIPVAASLPPECAGFILTQPDPVLLEPGQSIEVQLAFSPTAAAAFACLLDLGTVLPPIQLLGTGLEPGTESTVSPASLPFPDTVVGLVSWDSVRIENIGSKQLQLVVSIPDAAGFVTDLGADPFEITLHGGDTVEIAVGFQPLAAGAVRSELLLGAGIQPVPLAGTGLEPVTDCSVFPTELDFGMVYPGNRSTRTFTVTNHGNLPLHVPIDLSGAGYFMIPGSADIAPGESAVFTVVFAPQYTRPYYCTIGVGQPACGTIAGQGFGCSFFMDYPPSSDEIGIFFDGDLLQAAQMYPTYQPLTAYLAIFPPYSLLDGIGGWECRLEIDGPALLLDAELHGDGLNSMAAPSFRVGLGSPLPSPSEVVLATLTLLLTGPDPVGLSLYPLEDAVLPDQMSYQLWNQSVQRPLKWVWDNPLTAVINSEITVGTGTVTPSARLTGGAVTLSWPAPAVLHDACVVYRRIADGDRQRLDTLPQAGSGQTVEYVDHPRGIAPGTTLYYCYAVLAEGQEIAMSPEVEIRLAGTVPSASRLTGNFPNPFNPETEIRFELSRSGRVLLAVYDMTGHRVALLVDAFREAGPGTVTWIGRDDAGRALPSGTYLLRLQTPDRIDHRKMMLLK